MSRHRFVKALDLDDELDVYEGDGAYDEDEDQEVEKQLQEGTSKVKAVLGDAFTDAEIRDSLWHYYYDVEKTVAYLLSPSHGRHSSRSLTEVGSRSGSATPSKKQKTPSKASKAAQEYGSIYCSVPSPSKRPEEGFFQDCPWFRVPPERRAEISVVPIRPYRGLLGGASSAPKQSKLGALMAARKKKENERISQPTVPANNSVALLDKLDRLNLKAKGSDSGTASAADSHIQKRAPEQADQEIESSRKARRYIPRKKVEPVATEAPNELPVKPLEEQVLETPSPAVEVPIMLQASAFARTLIGSSDPKSSSATDACNESYSIFQVTFTENPFAGPSPDDIVARAQSASKGLKNSKTPSKTPNKEKNINGLSGDLERAKITESPRVKSKNINVVAEYENLTHKNAANFVVVGHVDAGKSTLMGRLLQDVGVVDKRTIDKYQKDASKIGKASFALAWVMDEGAEERARGVTIDVATNRFETDKTVFTVLDSPGHRDFVPNMIAGASRADFAVLVLDASTGNFESGLKGQTKEHTLLLRSLGVQRIVAAVNKLDMVSWSQERFDEVAQQTAAFLTAAGFQTSNVSFIPCSGLQGENVAHRSELKELDWYKGTFLLQELEAAASPRDYPLRGPLRMPVADIVTGGAVYPLSVSGRLSSGTLQVGDNLIAVPSNATGYVRALEVDSAQADYTVAGQNATIHIADMDATQLRRGDVICSPSSPLQPKTSLTLKALAFTHLTPMFTSVIAGRIDVQGRIEKLVALLDKTSGKPLKARPRIVKPGEVARLKITIEAEGGLPVEAGARLVLRAGGETIATGVVE